MVNPHSFLDALRVFRKMYSGIEFVVDVGVQGKTQPLIDVYGDARHLLYEPVLTYRDEIERNYAATNHELYSMAVGNAPGRLFQHLLSKDNSGAVTHSYLSPDDFPDPALEKFYVGVTPVEVVTLDDHLSGQVRFTPHNVLLKIDVDGLDSDVLRGAARLTKNVALVVIEAAVGRIGERIGIGNELGFELWDITSPAYYFDQLSQVDLFMVNAGIKARDVAFRPWDKTQGAVEWSEWRHFD